MADLDEELIARAIRWCADAGRHASPAQLRAALTPLTWDQLLAVRARLADPPPARPLGPGALADLGRGALPEVAAERERAGQYARDDDVAASPDAPEAPAQERPPTKSRSRRRPRGAVAPVVHRVRDRPSPVAEPALDRRPMFEALAASEGRAVLERLIRKHGARRAPLLQQLAAGWRRLDGAVPGPADLERLLQLHGLARAFERRERDELLHALRAAGGIVSAAAARVGTTVEDFTASLQRLGATAPAEAIRDVHRADVRRRATLSERVRLLLTEAARLSDLGILVEIEDDLRARLPEHLRALRAAGAAPLATALVQTLAMGPRDLPILLGRLGLTLDLGAPNLPRPGQDRPPPRYDRPRRGEGRPRSAPARPGRSGGRPSSSARGGSSSRRPPSGARPGLAQDRSRSGPRRPSPTRRPPTPRGRPRSK